MVSRSFGVEFFMSLRYKIMSVGSGLKPMRTGHKQGKMQLTAFTC
jgi:hypothetical protein